MKPAKTKEVEPSKQCHSLPCTKFRGGMGNLESLFEGRC